MCFELAEVAIVTQLLKHFKAGKHPLMHLVGFDVKFVLSMREANTWVARPESEVNTSRVSKGFIG